MKERKSDLMIASVGPHVRVHPDQSLAATGDIYFVTPTSSAHAWCGVSCEKLCGMHTSGNGSAMKPSNFSGCDI